MSFSKNANQTLSTSQPGDNLPPGWGVTSLRDLASSIEYGYTASAIDQKDGPRFLRITDIQDRQVDWAHVPTCDIPPEGLSKYRLQCGDIVFARTGATTGKSVLIEHCPEAIFASYLIRVRLYQRIDPKFVAYFFQTSNYWAQIEGNKKGTGQPGVNATVLGTIEVPVAPLNEQRAIVTELETKLSRLDAAVEGLKRVKANLKRYRASVLKAAVEGRLVPTEAELARQEGRAYEPAAVLLERILVERRRRWEQAELARLETAGKPPRDDKWKAKYQEPAAPDTSNLPALPEGWCWATVEQLASDKSNSLTDGPFGSNLKTAHYTNDGPRVVRLQNIGDGIFLDESAHISVEHYEKLNRHAVYAGDLVIASLGTEIPKACMVPEWLGLAIVKADCIRFAPDPLLASQTYLMHALNSQPIRKRTEQVRHPPAEPGAFEM